MLLKVVDWEKPKSLNSCVTTTGSTMGFCLVLMGLFWLVFSKPLSVSAAKYYESLRAPLMSAEQWRIIIIMMGCMACLFGVLMLFEIIPPPGRIARG
jgi:hypothetical protein